MRGFIRNERGASLVEFAIVLPVLLLLLIGLIEIGRFTYYSILASSAARAGVQYGAQNLATAVDRNGMTSAAQLDGRQTAATWTITPNYYCSSNNGPLVTCPTGGVPSNTTYYVQVQVSGTFNTLFRYPGLPPHVTVGGSSTMRVVSQ